MLLQCCIQLLSATQCPLSAILPVCVNCCASCVVQSQLNVDFAACIMRSRTVASFVIVFVIYAPRIGWAEK